MKPNFLVLISIMFFNTTFAQTEFCNTFRTGVFQFSGINGGVYTIIRNDSNQFERNTKKSGYSYMTIKWVSACEYVLSERIEYKGGRKVVKDTLIKEMYNTVYKFEKPDKYYVKTYTSVFPDTVETIFTKLDTTGSYINIFQRQEFADYKNSKTYGQKLLGQIHAIDYYESNKKENNYLIIFETSFQAEKLNWSKLLDKKIIDLKKGQTITNANCRFKGEYDDEILAIYVSEKPNEEAKIIKAYRFNRLTSKIEPINTKFVQYKETDRDRIK